MVKRETIRNNELTIFKGEPQLLEFSITDQDGEIYDLSAQFVEQVELRITKNISSSLSDTTRVFGNEDINQEVEFSNGDVLFEITKQVLEGLSPGVYDYTVSVVLTNNAGSYTAEKDTLLIKENTGAIPDV